MLNRASWQAAFRGHFQPQALGAKKAGNADPEAEEPAPARGARAAGRPPKPGPGGNLLGAPATRTEYGRSLDHRPKSPAGRYMCWDFGCHKGCQQKECRHAHKPLGALKLLDRSVQMQLIRRGGIKTGPRVTTDDEANAQIKALRDAQEKEDASKRGPKKSGEVTTAQQPPDELTAFATTDLEEDLRITLQGADAAWLSNAHTATATWSPPAPPGSQERQQAMTHITRGD